MAESPERDDRPVGIKVSFPWRLLVSLALGAVVFAATIVIGAFMSGLHVDPGH